MIISSENCLLVCLIEWKVMESRERNWKSCICWFTLQATQLGLHQDEVRGYNSTRSPLWAAEGQALGLLSAASIGTLVGSWFSCAGVGT